jgi:hypothetical protein
LLASYGAVAFHVAAAEFKFVFWLPLAEGSAADWFAAYYTASQMLLWRTHGTRRNFVVVEPHYFGTAQ